MGQNTQERLELKERYGELSLHLSHGQEWTLGQVPLGTLFTSVWGNLERCSQFDDSTRQMLALCYQEALRENGFLDLLELQDASQHLS